MNSKSNGIITVLIKSCAALEEALWSRQILMYKCAESDKKKKKHKFLPEILKINTLIV